MKLVKIFKELRNESIKFKLNIIGTGSEYKNIINYIKLNKLEKNITIVGVKNKKQISKMLDKTDNLISCSKVETFGITIAESIAKGVPPIVLNSGGPTDFINLSNSYPVNSFNELKNKIKSVIEKPRAFNKKKMNNFIFNKFSEKALIKKYNMLIKKII